MAVADVWGRVQGRDALPLSRDGDDWFFPMPSGASGTLVAEFWAEDEAGNVGYRAALITLDKGAIKCWRWLDDGCTCIMMAVRPIAEMTERRVYASLTIGRPVVGSDSSRPSCILRPHICPMAEG